MFVDLDKNDRVFLKETDFLEIQFSLPTDPETLTAELSQRQDVIDKKKFIKSYIPQEIGNNLYLITIQDNDLVVDDYILDIYSIDYEEVVKVLLKSLTISIRF